ncbi:MAG TPA: hypothetical protein PK536_13825, partial [Ignavibacteria bacterium]|nr:hypothetical protein [Ignavibacteria bacterium]
INLKISVIILLIILSVSGFNNSYSQIASICEDTTDASAGNGIPKRSPANGEFYRVLILYVAFSDDNASTDWNIWPVGGKPENPYTSDHRFIDTSELSNYTDYTYSKWFQEMSRDSFDFIGDEVLVNLPLSALDYKNLGYGFGTMNNVVLNRIDSLIDFSRYDNWKLVNNQWEWGADGNVDFVIMNYRNIPNSSSWFFFNSGIGGIATIGTSATLDGKFIGTGVTALGLLNRLTRTQVIVIHEICHSFFGHTPLGLMTPGHGQSTYHLSPHEREDIGYIQPTVVSYSSSSQSFTLRDYIKYGDCLKIQIPNSSPAEYFYIANHQKKSKYDGLARGSNTCWGINNAEQDPYCDKNKGLFLYHSSGGCSNNHGREVDVENAEGKWNWQVDYTINVPVLGGTTPILSAITRNVNTGYEEYGKQMISGTYSPVLINDNPCSSNQNDYFITWDDKGDEMDAYNIGYDEIFSPYSNPASNSCSSPTSNSGLTFNLESQDTSGAITLKIYYDDEDALFDLPPSKPKNLKVGKQYFGEPESYKFYPVVSWDSNIEPDFYDAPAVSPLLITPVYEIYRADTTECDIEPVYSLITTVSSTTTEYVDYNVTLYDNIQDVLEYCEYPLLTYSYKILAKDNRGNRSLKSERGLVTGYYLDCGEESEDIIVTENNILPDKF